MLITVYCALTRAECNETTHGIRVATNPVVLMAAALLKKNSARCFKVVVVVNG